MTYFWLDQDNQIILDAKSQIANECYEFISKALENGDSVLVNSVKGQSRAFTIIAMWIMRRYKWSLPKTLEFLNSRRPDLEIRPNFVHQLTAYENRLVVQGLGPRTSTWTEIAEQTVHFENEELLLRNTYLNAQMGPIATLPGAGEKPNPPKLRWADDPKERIPLATVIEENIEKNGMRTGQTRSLASKPYDNIKTSKDVLVNNFIGADEKTVNELLKGKINQPFSEPANLKNNQIEGTKEPYDKMAAPKSVTNPTNVKGNI